MAEIIEFEFEGETYEADKTAPTNYLFLVGMASPESDFSAFVESMNMLFPDGRHREYAKRLDGNTEKMGELVKTAIEAIGAKN